MDDSTVDVRPLRISLLTEFLKEFKGLEKVADDDEKSIKVLVNCVQVALKQYKPELAEDRKKIEDLFDLPTIYKVIDVASGMNLSDTSALMGAISK